jgi:uncharacterized protein
VTGASSGIGEAMVRLLAADGAAVLAVARRADRLAALANSLSNVEAMVADLTVPADLDRVATRAAEIDLLINNAGLGIHQATATATPHSFDGQIAVNVAAVVELSRAAAVAMVARRRGWILNVSSVAGGIPTPMNAAYGASKAFVTSYSDALGLECRPHGVLVTALLPGYTHSEFHEVSGGPAPTGRPAWAWQTAEEVARCGLADAASGRTRSTPGLHNRVAVGLTRHLPRQLLNRLVDR